MVAYIKLNVRFCCDLALFIALFSVEEQYEGIVRYISLLSNDQNIKWNNYRLLGLTKTFKYEGTSSSNVETPLKQYFTAFRLLMD